MKLFTIGFTRKNAEQFFTKLKAAGVRRVIDVRLNNQSQLAGFTKKDDLRYFLLQIGNIDYTHIPELAPTQAVMDSYKKDKVSWQNYEKGFCALLASRKVEKTLDPSLFDGACLLCSEHEPDHCHRSLIARYLAEKWGSMEVVHLT